MRLLALAPLLALAAAEINFDIDLDLPSYNPLCPSDAPTNTLWIAEKDAYACAPLPSGGSYASPASCIKTSLASLQGNRDLCEGSGDCVGGVCVEVGGDLKRVCWTVATGGECEQFSKSQ